MILQRHAASPLDNIKSSDQPSSLQNLSNARVMIVDGEQNLVDLVKGFLQDAGYANFLTANDATVALRMLIRQRPDALLLDILIQGDAGFELLAEIRNSDSLRYLPVLVLSSVGDIATKMRALELGATDFLSRPVDPSELSVRLRNALAQKSYRDQLAQSDALTGLPNRQVFLQRLTWALKLAQRRNTLCAVLQVGLDRFKQINETLGYEIGDEILRAVSQRLSGAVRETDTVSLMHEHEPEDDTSVSRLSGDEFIVLASDIGQAEDAAVIARRMLEAMKAPLSLFGKELFVTVSVGIAIYPQDAKDSSALLGNATQAMTRAKTNGRNAYAFWSPTTNAHSYQNLSLETALRKDLEKDSLQLHYQPQVDFRGGHIVGAEALMRWHHPDFGWVPPSRFIPLAEQTGLILALGEMALRRACTDAVKWRQTHWDLTISVNVSSLQLYRGDLPQIVQSALDASGLPPACLVLELTESMLMDDDYANAAKILAIKNLGVRLSIDDFGVGYSSLAYLKRLPLDELKMDKLFVDDLPFDVGSAAIAGAVIAMAHGLGLTVVAEGVESQAQADFLKERGCNQYQGYFFSRPVPAADLLTLLTQSGSTRPMLSQDVAITGSPH